MPRLTVVTRAGEERTVDGHAGWSVMEVIKDHGFDEMLAICGGCCSCATCHVVVDPAFADRLPPIGDNEEDLLDTLDHRDPTSRLSCQIRFEEALDGLKVRIAAEE